MHYKATSQVSLPSQIELIFASLLVRMAVAPLFISWLVTTYMSTSLFRTSMTTSNNIRGKGSLLSQPSAIKDVIPGTESTRTGVKNTRQVFDELSKTPDFIRMCWSVLKFYDEIVCVSFIRTLQNWKELTQKGHKKVQSCRILSPFR